LKADDPGTEEIPDHNGENETSTDPNSYPRRAHRYQNADDGQPDESCVVDCLADCGTATRCRDIWGNGKKRAHRQTNRRGWPGVADDSTYATVGGAYVDRQEAGDTESGQHGDAKLKQIQSAIGLPNPVAERDKYVLPTVND